MIDSYRFGRMVIGGRTYRSDLIIFPDRIMDGWWREKGHSLSLRDLKEVLDFGPGLLIIGTGDFGMMKVPEETREEVRLKGIELIAERTPKAYKRYNQTEDRSRTVAAFHLTC